MSDFDTQLLREGPVDSATAFRVADEIERLQDAKRRALQVADERAREANELRQQLVKDDPETRRKIAAAICCGAHKLGCAAHQKGSEFVACQMSTFLRDAERVLEVLTQTDDLGK